jgi:hypothetical protein
MKVGHQGTWGREGVRLIVFFFSSKKLKIEFYASNLYGGINYFRAVYL